MRLYLRVYPLDGRHRQDGSTLSSSGVGPACWGWWSQVAADSAERSSQTTCHSSAAQTTTLVPSTDLQIYGKTVSRLRIFTNLLQNKIAAKKRTEFDTKLCNKNGTKAHKSRQILNSRPTELCMLRQNFWGALLSRSAASATLSKCPPSIRDYVIYGQPKAVNQERRSG